MKTVILYASHHHGNTKKLVDAMKEQFDVSTVDIEHEKIPDVSDYDCIGFASGIDFGKVYEPIRRAAQETMCRGKAVFFLYTCGQDKGTFDAELRKLAKERGCEVLGSFGCKGFDTYGPWKLIGGINKNHPDNQDIMHALSFYKKSVDESMLKSREA